MLTWIVEHLLLQLPMWLWTSLAFAGAFLYYFSDLITALPQYKAYGIFIKLLSIIALLGGVFMAGGEGVSSIWQEKIKVMNEKVAAAEAKSAVTNTRIETKIVEKIKIVKSAQVVIKDRVTDKQKTIDSECNVKPEVIDILNKATKMPGNDQ